MGILFFVIILVVRIDARVYIMKENIVSDRYVIDITNEATDRFIEIAGNDKKFFCVKNERNLSWDAYYLNNLPQMPEEMLQYMSCELVISAGEIYNANEELFLLDYEKNSKNSIVKMSQVNKTLYNKLVGILGTYSNQIYIFIPEYNPFTKLNCQGYDIADLSKPYEMSFIIDSLPIINESKNGKIYKLTSDYLIDPDSIGLSFETKWKDPTGIRVDFKEGFGELEDLGGYNNRWCLKKGTLMITNLFKKPQKIVLTFAANFNGDKCIVKFNNNEIIAEKMKQVSYETRLDTGCNEITIECLSIDGDMIDLGMINLVINRFPES